MFGQTFYHSTIKNVLLIFGELFSNLKVNRYDSAGNVAQTVKVPIEFGQKNSWYYKNFTDPNYGNTSQDPLQTTQKPIDTVFPRMVYTLGSINRDPQRKVAAMNRQVAGNNSDPTSVYRIFAPMPVLIGITLTVVANDLDDLLQIVEQIAPNFVPDFNVPAYIKKELNLSSDIGFTLQYPLQIEDNWNAPIGDTRQISIDLEFTANVELYGNTGSQNIITNINVNIHNQLTDGTNAVINIVPNPSNELPTANPVETTTTITEMG